MTHLLASFDRVRIINLVDRADRRREMMAQLARIGGLDGAHIGFFAATRPPDPGSFPSLGARGCFESHLAILREAHTANAAKLLILEDDCDFADDVAARAPALLDALAGRPWGFFYGAHVLPPRAGGALAAIDAGEEVLTTAFVAIDGALLGRLIAFLDDLRRRPIGAPEYGPMHVDGAYSVFRRRNPDVATWAAFPPLGHQRSSRSDITPSGRLLDRLPLTRGLANGLRRVRSRLAAR